MWAVSSWVACGRGDLPWDWHRRRAPERVTRGTRERWTLIYDGDCQFCRRQVQFVENRDRRGRIDAVPFQTTDLDALGIGRHAAEDAMHLVSPAGVVWHGAAAARETLKLLPGLRPAAWLFALPGAMYLAELTYRWVARRRHRFGCDSPACRRGARRSDENDQES